MSIKIGSDPELFVKRDGALISAHNLVPGSKEKPHKVPRGAVQVDGMALEFNIDPVSTENGFVRNTLSVLESLQTFLPQGDQFVFSPIAEFGLDYIMQQPIEARELGCDPDYNAYTGQYNPTPNVELPFRTASGHIHIGWREGVNPLDPVHFEECCMVVKELDATLGLLSVLEEPVAKGRQRRELYGRAGAFRPKSYGVEYRVLSNYWLKNEEAMRRVYKIVNLVMEKISNPKISLLQDRRQSNTIRSAINQMDRKRANLYVDNYLKEEGYAAL